MKDNDKSKSLIEGVEAKNEIKTDREDKYEKDNIKEANKKGKKRLITISIPILLFVVIIISVIVTMIMQNNSKDEYIDEGSSTVEQNDVSSVLSEGSVTTTIDGKTIEYSGAYVVDGIEATISSGTYESANDNEVVFLVINGGTLRIDGDVTINKTGSEGFQGRGDNYSFYGINSAIAVVGEGSSAIINGATINSDVSGANGVVATNGGEVTIENSEITTSKNNSRGLHATYKGIINADGVKISTQGGSCASLATDRGEGTIKANNMTLSTAGAGSPLIYSTGSITVTNSTGTAEGAQIAVVEGKNSISLDGCDFSANGNGNRNEVDNAGVMIYQSMSGDAGVGTGTFIAKDCVLKVLESSKVYTETSFFFVTNTNATIELTDTEISFSDATKFISALGTNEWGRTGSNGGAVTISVSGIKSTNTEVETDSISSVSGL